METYHIEPVNSGHQQRVAQFLEQHWGSTHVVSLGKLHDARLLSGFIALAQDRMVGLATYQLEGQLCELVTINSEVKGVGIGTALITAIKEAALSANCHRLWLITTNDNLAALGFYQKRGFRITAVHPNAIKKSRLLKPQIPLIGLDGIPLRDEIELEMVLG